MTPIRPATIGILLAVSVGAQEPGRLDEYQYKAKFIGFATYYTAFPARPGPPQPWVLGVLGRSPFGKYLDESFTPETTIKARWVKVVYPRTEQDVIRCDVLFICRSEQARLDEVLGWVKGRPILTISDSRGFALQGVMVNFYIEQSYVKTEVNVAAAKKAGLEFSSSFLKNARLVAPTQAP